MDDKLKNALSAIPGVQPFHIAHAQAMASAAGFDFSKVLAAIVQYLPMLIQILSSLGLLKPTPPAPTGQAGK